MYKLSGGRMGIEIRSELSTWLFRTFASVITMCKIKWLYAKKSLDAITHQETIASLTLLRDYVTEITVSNYEHDIFNFIWLWDHPIPSLSSSWNKKIIQNIVKRNKEEHIVVTKWQSQTTTQTCQTPTRNSSHHSPMALPFWNPNTGSSWVNIV